MIENIVREAVSEWSYSGRMGSSKGLELLVSDLTARLEAAHTLAVDGEIVVCPECGSKLDWCTECEKRIPAAIKRKEWLYA